MTSAYPQAEMQPNFFGSEYSAGIEGGSGCTSHQPSICPIRAYAKLLVVRDKMVDLIRIDDGAKGGRG